MPKATKVKDVTDPFGGYEFINFTPNADQKKAWRQWDEQTDWDTKIGMLSEVVMDGYKLSMSYGENDTAYATLTDKSEGLQFSKRVLSIRAGYVGDALSRILFLHVMVADRDWNNLVTEDPNDVW